MNLREHLADLAAFLLFVTFCASRCAWTHRWRFGCYRASRHRSCRAVGEQQSALSRDSDRLLGTAAGHDGRRRCLSTTRNIAGGRYRARAMTGRFVVSP